MTGEDLKACAKELTLFHDRFSEFFVRQEIQKKSKDYMTALMLDGERKNGENLAEQIPEGEVRAVQWFLSQSAWDDRQVVNRLQEVVDEGIGSLGGILITDDTGFEKKGKESAGVGRQYSGTLGKVDNCQVGVFLGYAVGAHHVLVDKRLYVLKDWFDDPERMKRCHMPQGLEFKTKPELALEMIRQARANGLRHRWNTFDEFYGEATGFLDGLDEMGEWYVGEIATNTRFWLKAPEVISVEKERQRMGQAAYRQRLAAGSPKAKTVKAIYQNSQGLKFKKIKVSEGGKGPRVYEFARLKAIEVRKGLPSKTKWLLVRRNLDGSEVKFFISNAPQEVSLKEMAKVASSRWPVEISFEEAKQEVGLDEYEVRSWRGWHHHITMSMLALAFLTFARKRLGEKNDRDDRSGSKANLAMAFA